MAESSSCAEPQFIPKPIDLYKQSVPVPGTAKPGSTPAYRNALSSDKLIEGPPINGGPRTVYECFHFTARKHPEYQCLGHRAFNSKNDSWSSYTWQTYHQVATRMTHFGSGLVKILADNVVPKVGMPKSTAPGINSPAHHIGLYSVNNPEWIIADGACACYSMVSVALYDTLGHDTVQFITNHAELRVIVCTPDKLINLIQVREQCPELTVLVSMHDLNTQSGILLKAWAQEKNLIVMTFTEVEDLGKSALLKHTPPQPSDIATICYTSGTTGPPKGAMLTHRNLASTSVYPFMGLSITNDDTHISYLPLAHIFERIIIIQSFCHGAKTGFFRGDVNLLIEDIVELKPTLFISVPRLLNRIYAKIRAGTVDAPGVRGVLFRRAFAEKLARLKSGGGNKHLFWDGLLFSKVQSVLGGRVRLICSGSAPLGKDVMQFLRVVFATEVLEGYGQTENTAGATVQIPGEFTAGNVGCPFPNCEIKLDSVPEMDYLVTDKPFPRGEICIRGPNVFLGYWKDEKKTKEAIDSDGWLRTGDIGLITDRGQFSVIDRKKNIFKLSQGEYVAPERIENVIMLCPLVAQVFVHGDSLQSQLVAIIVPNQETFVPWAMNHLSKSPTDDFKKICMDEGVNRALLNELNVLGKKKKLRGFEFVKAIYLETEPFSVENELLTPSFKLKRSPHAVDRYRREIDTLYANLASVAGPHNLSKL